MLILEGNTHITIVPTLSICPSATDLVPYQNASANAENTLKNCNAVKKALLFEQGKNRYYLRSIQIAEKEMETCAEHASWLPRQIFHTSLTYDSPRRTLKSCEY